MNKSSLENLFSFTLRFVLIGSGYIIIATVVLALGFLCRYTFESIDIRDSGASLWALTMFTVGLITFYLAGKMLERAEE